MDIIKNFGNYFIDAMIGIILVVTSATAIMLTGMIKYNGIFKNIDFVMILLMLGGFIIQAQWKNFFAGVSFYVR